jgi:hypothetical protein
VLGIVYQHQGEEKTARIGLLENPALAIMTFERAGLPVTPAILQFRKSWLGGR